MSTINCYYSGISISGRLWWPMCLQWQVGWCHLIRTAWLLPQHSLCLHQDLCLQGLDQRDIWCLICLINKIYIFLFDVSFFTRTFYLKNYQLIVGYHRKDIILCKGDIRTQVVSIVNNRNHLQMVATFWNEM